ncbi:MAG: hypothetical protein KKE24_03455 [Candidatus Thermoplasmatota archaeon]|nr:hypothetical protein [Candidatus Thermoplasmatota archaeon]
MRGLVVYDSYYGNTKAVAEAIAEEIRAMGHDAVMHSARESFPKELDYGFLFIGSPTRMTKMTSRTKKFVKKLGKSSWSSKPVYTYDTIMTGAMENAGRWSGTAAQKLHDLAKDVGLNPDPSVLHTDVTGMKGPLAKDAIDKAKAYVRDSLSKLDR